MKPLTGPDAFFLYTETPEQHQHTLGVLVLDPVGAPAGFSVAELRAKLEAEIDAVPEFRQKLLNLPFGVVPPTLVDDPDFKYRNHFHHIACPAPGDLRALGEVLSDIASVQLDRRKPLWESWIIDGLSGGRIAVVTKSHHCIADGVQGAAIMSRQFDTEPSPAPHARRHVHSWHPQAHSLVAVGRAAWTTRWKTAPGFAGLLTRTWRSARKRSDIMKTGDVSEQWVAPMFPQGPRLRFNGAITPNRAVALGQVEIAALKRIKDHFAVKLNDVVLTACALALRDHLIGTNDLPAEPLLCAVPVSMAHKEIQHQGQGNQVGNMLVKLPVDIADPQQCLAAVHHSTQQSKRVFEASYEGLFNGVVAALPPLLSGLAMRSFFSKRVVDTLPVSMNLVISNFPGPGVDLYMLGAKLVGSYPIGPVQSGSGLIITFMSRKDRMDYSVQSCRDKLPQVWDLADGIARHVDALLAAASPAPARARAIAAKASHVDARSRSGRRVGGASVAGRSLRKKTRD